MCGEILLLEANAKTTKIIKYYRSEFYPFYTFIPNLVYSYIINVHFKEVLNEENMFQEFIFFQLS